MMRFFFAMAALVLAALNSGCASPETRDDVPIERSYQEMTETVKLTDLEGQWFGNNSLWVMPEDPVRESDSEASVTIAVHGTVALITYTWAYEGTPQEGTLLVRTGPEDVETVLVDPWHTGGKFMTFSSEGATEDLVDVRGSYAAPPGPDWGWRIILRADSADEFLMLMYNITPDGEEAPAVEARYTRVGAGR